MAIQRVDYFMNQIAGIEGLKLKKVCLKEVDYLRKNYKLSVFRTSLTPYRKAVKDAFESPRREIILSYLTLTDEEAIQCKVEQESRLSERLQGLKALNDVDGLLMKAEELLTSSSYLHKILGLAALTGRRPAEIACTANFTPSKTREGWMLFEGQLKGKEREDLAPYEIMVLTAPEKITRALSEIRERKPEFIDNPKRFHDAASKELNKLSKKFFSEFTDSEVSPSDLRPIYAEIVYLFLEIKTIAKPKFFSILLGHAPDDNKTGMSYQDWYIADESYQ